MASVALAGRLIARVALPPRWELLQGSAMASSWGARRDAEGVDRVEVFTVSMAKHESSPACALRTAALPVDTSSITRMLRTDMQHLQGANEAYYADYDRYPTTFDALNQASGINPRS